MIKEREKARKRKGGKSEKEANPVEKVLSHRDLRIYRI
jgi:hypothetical protein